MKTSEIEKLVEMEFDPDFPIWEKMPEDLGLNSEDYKTYMCSWSNLFFKKSMFNETLKTLKRCALVETEDDDYIDWGMWVDNKLNLEKNLYPFVSFLTVLDAINYICDRIPEDDEILVNKGGRGWNDLGMDFLDSDFFEKALDTYLHENEKKELDIILSDENLEQNINLTYNIIREITKIDEYETFLFNFFVSYLINNSDSVHSISLPKDIKLDYVGAGLDTKNDLTFYGDVGDYFCYRIKEGQVLLNGDAGHYSCDFMSGGQVKLQNAYTVGRFQKGGEVFVQNIKSHSNIGRFMQGGKIFIEHAEEIVKFGEEMTGGKIHVKTEEGLKLFTSKHPNGIISKKINEFS